MKTLALFSIKGGVGKTSSAVNLALLAAREGAPTLLCDLDPQGAASFHFRVQPKVAGGVKGLIRREGAFSAAIKATDFDHLDLLPADFSYRHFDVRLDRERRPEETLARLVGGMSAEYDYAFLDCAPGASLVSDNIYTAADVLLVPTIPTVLSLRTLARLLKHLAGRATPPPRVLPFFCMVDRRKALHRKVCSWTAGQDLQFLSTQIPYSSAVELMSVRRAPLGTYAPASPAARAYLALWNEIRERLSEPAAPPADPRAVRALLDDLRGGRRDDPA